MAQVIGHNPYDTIIHLAPSSAALTNTSRFVSGAHGADAVGGPFLHDLTFSCTWTVAPTAGTTIDVYQIRAVDGTNYDDGSTSVTPDGALLLASFTPRAITTIQRGGRYDLPGAPGLYVYLIVNNTGQTMPAGWTLDLRTHSVLSSP